MEITKIEQWQILSSHDHSSLIVHCSHTPKFLMLFEMKDSFLSNRHLLGSINIMTDSYTTPSHTLKKKFRNYFWVFPVTQQVNTR